MWGGGGPSVLMDFLDPGLQLWGVSFLPAQGWSCTSGSVLYYSGSHSWRPKLARLPHLFHWFYKPPY